MKITQEANAWLSDATPDRLCALAEGRIHAGDLTYTHLTDMSAHGWVRIGAPTITLELPSPDVARDIALSGLRESITTIRAAAQAKITEIEGQIANLLALPMSDEDAQ